MKRQIIIGLSILICGVLQSQETGSYLHFNVGGGLHNLSYNLQDGTQKGQAGYTINAAYSYFFAPQWGVQAGIGLQSFNALSTLNYISGSTVVDMDGDSYEFRSNYNNWQEKQDAFFFDIPVVLQYRHSISKKIGIIASVGGKISFPVSAGYKTSGGTLTTTGYYSQWDVELSDMPQHGFSTFTDFKGNLSLKPAYMGIVDLGGLYKISEKIELYLGGYLNYGLNNLITQGTKLMYQPDGVYNGVFASTQTSEVKPISFGLKVGVYLRLSKNKSEIPVEQPVENNKLKDTVKVVTPVVVEEPKAVVLEPVVIPETVRTESPFEVANRLAAIIGANFANKSYILGNSEDEKIKQLSDILKVNPNISLNIKGHTDNTGSHEINFKYGMKRALAMKQKFVEQGVSESQMKVHSKAYDEPLAPNTTEENKSKNRRVEVIVVEK